MESNWHNFCYVKQLHTHSQYSFEQLVSACNMDNFKYENTGDISTM